MTVGNTTDPGYDIVCLFVCFCSIDALLLVQGAAMCSKQQVLWEAADWESTWMEMEMSQPGLPALRSSCGSFIYLFLYRVSYKTLIEKA